MFRPVQAKYRLWIWILAITADIQVEPAANIVYNKGQGTNRQKIYRLHLPHLPISAVNADRIQRSLKMGKSKKRHSRRHSKSNKAKVSNAAKRNNPANKAGVQEKTAEAGRPLIPDSTEQVSAGSPAAAASDKTFQAEKAGRDRFFAQKAAPAGRPFAAETADADRSPAQKATPAGRPSAAETADADRSPAQKAAPPGRLFAAETADADQAFVQEAADTPSRLRIRPLPILTTIAGIAVCFVVILYFNGRIAGNLPGSAVFTNLPVSYPQSAGTGITTKISEPTANRTIPGDNESIDTSDDNSRTLTDSSGNSSTGHSHPANVQASWDSSTDEEAEEIEDSDYDTIDVIEETTEYYYDDDEDSSDENEEDEEYEEDEDYGEEDYDEEEYYEEVNRVDED